MTPTDDASSAPVTLPYEQRQPGTLMRYALVVPMVITVVVVMILGGGPEGVTIAATMVGILSVVLALFHSLTVVVTEERVEARFGFGFPRFGYEVADIVGARSVTNPWYLGWGIRWFPGGWLYNVSGFEAVEIELRSGRKYRFGTEEPDQLLAAVEHAAPNLEAPA